MRVINGHMTHLSHVRLLKMLLSGMVNMLDAQYVRLIVRYSVLT